MKWLRVCLEITWDVDLPFSFDCLKSCFILYLKKKPEWLLDAEMVFTNCSAPYSWKEAACRATVSHEQLPHVHWPLALSITHNSLSSFVLYTGKPVKKRSLDEWVEKLSKTRFQWGKVKDLKGKMQITRNWGTYVSQPIPVEASPRQHTVQREAEGLGGQGRRKRETGTKLKLSLGHL